MPHQCTGILDVTMFTCGQFDRVEWPTMNIHDNSADGNTNRR